MKTRLHSLLAIVFLCCLSLPALADKTVSIRADVWYPMNGNPHDSNRLGYMIDLAKAIFAKHGYSVDYQTMPWDRAIKTVRTGENDCVVGAYHSDAPDFVFPHESWGIDTNGFYVKTGNSWKYTGLASLKGKSLGLIGSYSYTDKIDNWAKQHKSQVQYVYANNSLEQNIHKVIGGRITATISSEAVMNAKLKDMGLAGKLQLAGTLGSPAHMYIACSPAKASSKLYAKWVTQGTEQMRKDGQLQKILAKYGLKDWK